MLGKIVKGVKTGFLNSLNGKQNSANTQLGTTGGVGSVDVSDVKPFYFSFLPPKETMKIDNEKVSKVLSGIEAFMGRGPAPRLAPLGGSNRWNVESGGGAHDPFIEDMDGGGPTTHVNIRDKHHWTESPMSSRGEVPYMILKEYKILANPALNQLINNVAVAGASVGRAAKDGAKILEEGAQIFNEMMDADGMENKMDVAMQKTNEVLASMQGEAPDATEFQDPLEPYKMMYLRAPTKFKYTLPYMEDVYRDVSNSTGDADAAKGILSSVDDLAALAGNTANDLTFRSMREPGIHVEKPKAFTFTGREKSYTVSFPLFNTKNYQEICKNWEFLYLLVYQNTPNRISKDLVAPPCIYEAKIPGVWYSKYAAITNIRVDFVGARREMPIKINFIENKSADEAPPPANSLPGNPVDSAGNVTPEYNATAYKDDNGNPVPKTETEWRMTKKSLMTVIRCLSGKYYCDRTVFRNTKLFVSHDQRVK